MHKRPKTLAELETYLTYVANGDIKRYRSGRAGSIRKWEILIATADEVYKNWVPKQEKAYGEATCFNASESVFLQYFFSVIWCDGCRLCEVVETDCDDCPLNGQKNCIGHSSWYGMAAAKTIKTWKKYAKKFLEHIKEKTARRKK